MENSTIFRKIYARQSKGSVFSDFVQSVPICNFGEPRQYPDPVTECYKPHGLVTRESNIQNAKGKAKAYQVKAGASRL